MSKKNDRIVYRTKDGHWATKKDDSTKVSSLHSTQKKAEDAARIMLRNQGGGQLTTKGLDGKIRSRDTITVAQTYHVFKNVHGEWSVKRSGTERAIKVFRTQEEAIEFAKEKSKEGRYVLVIHSKDGRISSKNSYGEKSNPPKDKSN